MLTVSVGCLQNLYGSVDELKEGKADKETVQIEVDEVCEHGCGIVQQSSATSVYMYCILVAVRYATLRLFVCCVSLNVEGRQDSTGVKGEPTLGGVHV